MGNNLTDHSFWKSYWESYEYEKIPKKVIYQEYLHQLEGKQNFIEIGGFPGINAAFFYQHICKDVSLLDFYIDKTIVNKLESYNDLPLNTIKCIEADFFTFRSERKYDIVFSCGFIEHFEDTKDVIKRHVELLSENGKLLIILPNFRGLNGFLQYLFDKENFKVHNLNSMKIANLNKIMSEMDVIDVQINYTRKPMLWLEPKPGKRYQIMRKIIKLFSHALKLFPIKCRLLSPYIIICANKKS